MFYINFVIMFRSAKNELKSSIRLQCKWYNIMLTCSLKLSLHNYYIYSFTTSKKSMQGDNLQLLKCYLYSLFNFTTVAHHAVIGGLSIRSIYRHCAYGLRRKLDLRSPKCGLQI